MRARWAGPALLALGGVAAGLGLAEGTLRALAPHRVQLYVPDETLLYRLRPGAREVLQPPVNHGGGPPVTLRINAAGYRGAELARGPGRRVVVYGDSFVEARFTPEEASFTERLRQYLASATGAPLEVVNAGVTGYGPDQVALRMERDLGSLRPALVVVALFAGNDWGDLVRDKLFRMDAQGGLVRNAPALDPAERVLVGPPAGGEPFAIVRALRRLQRRWRGDAAPPGEPRTLAWALRECARDYDDLRARPDLVANLVLDHYDADLALRPASESAAYKRRLMRAVLARIHAQAVRAKAPLLLLAIPDWRDLCAACAHRAEALGHAQYRPAALTDDLEEIARAEGIPLLNLFGPFQERADALYHARDGHWNEDGQALAARVTAARIVESEWLR